MTIHYRISNKKWYGYIRRILKGFKYILKEKEIGINFTDSQTIREVNREYRNKDESTDIVSIELSNGNYLGDIYLSREDIMKKIQCNFIDYNKFLIIHGTLHLMGHDHNNDEESEIMRLEEIRLMKQLNIKNSHILGDINNAE